MSKEARPIEEMQRVARHALSHAPCGAYNAAKGWRYVAIPRLPPSLNNLYPSGSDGRRHLSAEGRAWHYLVADACIVGRVPAFADKRVRLSVAIELLGLSYQSDPDGRVKACLDALATCLEFDDRYVEELTVRRVRVVNMPKLRETRVELTEVGEG